MATEIHHTRQTHGKGVPIPLLRNESGAALITSLLLMVVLLSLVPIAIQYNEVEIARSGEFKESREAFFLAEAGLEHAKLLTEQDSIRAALAGPDGFIHATPSHAWNADNGTFGAPGGTIVNGYDQVAFNGNDYLIQARDNDDGDGNPLSDNDFIIVLSAVGTVNGSTSTVEATVYYPTFPTSALTTNGNLQMSGNPHVLGPCGSAHSNGDLDLSGNPTVTHDVTASGSVIGSSINIGGETEGGQPEIPVPHLNPADYEQYADYVLAADGNIYDPADVNRTTPLSGVMTNWTWTPGNPTSTPPVPAEWKISGNSASDASIYVEGNVTISGNPPGPGNPPWEVTIVATGHIQVSGNPDFINKKNPADPGPIQDLFLIAGTDIKYNGNPSNDLQGLIYAGEQIDLSGNANIIGSVMAFNSPAAPDPNADGLVSQNKVSGNPHITYDCGLTIPNSGGVEVVSWQEL